MCVSNPNTVIDRHGVITPADARAECRSALDMLHTGQGDPQEAIKRALRADPELIEAYCLRAALHVMASRDDSDGELTNTLQAARALMHRADDRERRHLAAAEAWLARDLRRSLQLYGEIVLTYPHDTLALKVAHYGDLSWGRPERMRDRVAAVLPHWHAGMHGYDHVLAMYAFGLVETGSSVHAERIARQAHAIDPNNATAIHCVAHAMEMQGRSAEGIEWLNAIRPSWIDSPAFATHLYWHLALFHLDQGDLTEALRIHDEQLHPRDGEKADDLVDASALLWRLQLRGVDVTARWNEVADVWAKVPLDGLRPFRDAHAMLAFVATNRRPNARRLMKSLRAKAKRAHDLDRVVYESALPVCEAFIEFGEGNYAQAASRLETLRHLTQRCGGSLAQCDLLHLTWLEAALRSNQMRMARRLVDERTERRPLSLFNRRLQAQIGRLSGTKHLSLVT